MAPKRTGTIQKIPGSSPTRYRGRLRLKDGSRPWVLVPEGMSEARARDWVAAQQEREDVRGLLLRARSAPVDVEGASGVSLEKWLGPWLADRRARSLRSVDTDEGRARKHVLPLLKAPTMRAVTRDDLENVRDELDAKVRRGELKWKTASHVWGTVTKMFSDAVSAKQRELRVLETNPALGIKGPDRGPRTGKQFLYPDEFLTLVSSPTVPLKWRRVFAVTTYLYARAGEVKALDWPSIDFERAIAHIHQSVNRDTGLITPTKTGETRRLPVEPNLLPLLRALHDGAPEEGRVVECSGTDRKLARQLRRCLVLAGVTRRELIEGSPTTKAITFHDLRATGITWCAVRGDDPLRIKQRAGHRTFSTTEQYIREADNLGANFGEVFPPLPESLWSTDWSTEPRK